MSSVLVVAWMGFGATVAQSAFAQSALAPDVEAGSATKTVSEAGFERTRRHGYMTGASGGVALGAGRGYPNDNLFFRSNPPNDSQTSTGLGFGSGGEVWMGFSVYDSLGLSLGVSRAQWRKEDLRAVAISFQLRADVYPLMSWGGAWRDLGATGVLGAGRFRVDRNGLGVVRSNETSTAGVGAFFVPLRFWGIAMGPQIEYNYQFAIGVGVHSTVLGWRTSFLSGPA